MFLQTKKIIISLTTISIILTGCGGGGGSSTVSSSTTQTATTTTPSSKAVQTGQVKDFNTGKGLANVKVSLGNSTTTTDSNGFYTFSNITPTKEAVVTFVKEGYLIGSTKIEIKSLSENNALSPNYIEYALNTYQNQWSYNSQNKASGTHIDIAASTYTDQAGNSYTGLINASLTVLDTATDKGKTLFPGLFEGKDSNGIVTPFVSYGLISLKINDANGDPLSVSSDITLTFDKSVKAATAEEIPLWYYNYQKGIWIEEGFATRLADGRYQGTVSHPGTWSLSQAIEDASAVYTDRILYPDGTPVKNLRVYAVGKNWIREDLSTNENGEFEINVIPNEDFTIHAYHYRDKYSAEFNGVIPAIAPGNIVNKIQ